MKTSKRYTLLSALTILTVVPSIAMAASANVNINVNATVVGSCGINSSTVNYTFLDLDPAVGTNAVNTGSFDTQPQVWCTRGTTFTLTDSGNGAGTLTGTAPN